MEDLVLTIPAAGQERAEVLKREWLVTNGLGGYAAGTLGGIDTRRYHGLLIAALPAPHGRWVMLEYLEESLNFPDSHSVSLDTHSAGEGRPAIQGTAHLEEFRL